VFENRVLRRIFRPKRDEVTGEWRKMHNEKFHNLYSSPNIIRHMKRRRMRWAGHMARMGKERDHLEDQGVHMRMGTEMGLKEIGWEFRVDPVGSG
jgi:hypothetical protein